MMQLYRSLRVTSQFFTSHFSRCLGSQGMGNNLNFNHEGGREDEKGLPTTLIRWSPISMVSSAGYSASGLASDMVASSGELEAREEGIFVEVDKCRWSIIHGLCRVIHTLVFWTYLTSIDDLKWKFFPNRYDFWLWIEKVILSYQLHKWMLCSAIKSGAQNRKLRDWSRAAVPVHQYSMTIVNVGSVG